MSGETRGSSAAALVPLGKSIIVSTESLHIPMPPTPPRRAPVGDAPLNGMAQSLLGLADVAKARGDLEVAESHYRRALEIFEKLNVDADPMASEGK